MKTVENGGLKVYSTIDLQKQQQARAAIDSHEGGPVLDNQPAAALTSIDAHTGRILAMASSATYDQTKFDYPVQAHRQPGSAFKIFALMTLIHDYDGDPNQTYYTSKFLAPGWNSADPTWSVHTAEETYQGNDQHQQGDRRLRQHRVRAARVRPRLLKARRNRARDGHHLAARRIPLGGDRRSARRRDDARDG